MRDVVALVLAGGRTGQFGVLTQNRAKGSLTFAATYRIVDFALSNLRNSGIQQIGMIIQYLPSSLIEHVEVGRPWDLQGYGRLLKIMPPFVGIDETVWYKGTADALYQNLNIVSDLHPSEVVVLSGEHVYHLDYERAVRAHREFDADITMVTKRVSPGQRTSRFGYVETGDDNRVKRFLEKPSDPPADAGISTGTYIFKTSVLRELLAANAATQNHNLAKDILEPFAGSFRSFAHHTTDYWNYIGNAAQYYDAQFELTRGEGLRMLRSWGVLTNLEYRGTGFAPAAYFGSDAVVDDTMASGGCRIEGTVEHSILSPGVRVNRGAVVRNSILMHDCVVEAGAQLDGVISDKDARFGSECRVGVDPCDMAASPDITQDYGQLTLIGKGAEVAAGVNVPKTLQVSPGARLVDSVAVTQEIMAMRGERDRANAFNASPYFLRGRA